MGSGRILGEAVLQKAEFPVGLCIGGKGFINKLLVMLLLYGVINCELFNWL
jgi:hypothetical protein